MRRTDQNIPAGIYNIGKTGIIIKGKTELTGNSRHIIFFHQIIYASVRKLYLRIKIEYINTGTAADMRIYYPVFHKELIRHILIRAILFRHAGSVL